jgi:1-acyl-sn-glycerol-3-phosphate acyltransferase
MMKPLLALIARFVTGANSRWIGCAPDTRQRVYFANHTSNLDTLVIWASLPPEVRSLVRPVGARDYWTKNKLRLYIANEIFHAVLIERKKPTARDNPLTDMLDALGDRYSLIIFPEGSRQVSGEMAPFKGGLFHLAKDRPDIEFVPVLIENLNRILPKGEILPVPLLGGVSFGAPIKLNQAEEKAAFLDRAQTAIKAMQTS